jgi:hypothetical protein
LKHLFDPNNHHLASWVWLDLRSSLAQMPIQLFQVTIMGHFASMHYSTICGLNNVVEFLIIDRSRV